MESILGLAAVGLAAYLNRGGSSGLSGLADSGCSFWLGSLHSYEVRRFPLSEEGYRLMLRRAARMSGPRTDTPPFGIQCGGKSLAIGQVLRELLIEPNLDR